MYSSRHGLSAARYPVSVVQINVSADQLDVNLEPNKTSVGLLCEVGGVGDQVAGPCPVSVKLLRTWALCTISNIGAVTTRCLFGMQLFLYCLEFVSKLEF